jgi:PKD domain-containing protein
MQYKLSRLFFVLAFVVGLVLASTPQSAHAASPWYVTTTGNDANDCMSPATPCATINGAIGKATAGDTINVVAGTYLSSDSFAVVFIQKSITISGGWNDTFTSQSDLSIIDGQNIRKGIAVYQNTTVVTIDKFVVQNSFSIDNQGGGGIYNIGTLILNNSVIRSNTTFCNNCNGYWGGGIFNDNGNLTINNSTISGNSTYAGGGGIYNKGGTLILNNVTLSDNTTSSSGGGILNDGGTVTVQNSIISGNAAYTGADCSGAIGSEGYNLIGNTSGCTFTSTTGDKLNEDPLLVSQLVGSLGYYPLITGSPAIDAGNPATPGSGGNTCFATDQRGVTRPQGNTCDIGAYEYTTPGVAVRLSEVSGSSQHALTTTAFPKPLQATALDSQGTPVSGVTIVFTAPASGASGIFADTGTNTTSVTTDNSGIATTSIFTANNQAGAYTISATASGLGSITFTLEQFILPANDNFSNAEVIASLPFSATVNITVATNEPNEPSWCYSMPNTIWYSFTPTETMAVRVGTHGGAINANVNIYLAAGSGISGLQFLSCTSPGGSPTFHAEAGQTYYFQVGGVGEVGSVQINLQQVPSPANDNFSAAESINSFPFSASIDISGAWNESNEPQYCYTMLNTVWYTFTPTETMFVRTDTQGSNIDGNVNVYLAGSGISDLQFLSCSSNSGSSTFLAQAGQTYYLQAGGINGALGPILVNLKQVFPPTNDNFANAEAITSMPFSTAADITTAGNESNEPQNCSSMPNTVWYSFTPTETMMIQAYTQGGNFDTNMNVYHAGSGVSDLQFLLCSSYGRSNGTPFNFLAEAGQTYYLQVGGINGGLGTIQVNLKQVFPPANDDFVNTAAVPSMPFSTTVDITDATNEPSEPQYCYGMSNTIWYSFTPTENTLVRADTQGSTISNNLNIYKPYANGSGVTNLNFLGCTIYSGSATFLAEAGQTYYLQLGALNGEIGTVQINLTEIPRPANADFANAEAISGLPFSATPDITNAGVESNEPQWCNSMSDTVWYSFTPPETMSVRADTQGSAISGNVNVYHAGTGISDLQFLGCAGPGSSTQFVAEAGQTYYIQAGSTYGQTGNIHVNLQQFFPPANDNFASPEAIGSLPFSATPDVTNAGVEPNEPQVCYYMPNTVWYSFSPTENTLVRADTQGSAINSNINVYKSNGSGISNLTNLGCTIYNGPVTFLAEAGQTYYLQAGGLYGQVGTMSVNLEQLPLPANDDFAKATSITALPSTIDFDTTWATFQSGETSPSCAYPAPPYKTLWFAYTATQTGSISASIPSWNFSPFIAAYSGTGFNNLIPLGCNQYSNKITFHVVSGQTYYFQVGGLYGGGSTGQFLLETTPPPQASFYNYPSDPSRYDTIQFYDSSYDPGQAGFQTYTWNFGDGATATGSSPTHKYAADGNYQVIHTVTTTDGRSASITQTLQVRTHDVGITKITAPNSANVGQTKTITVTLRNVAYPETVQIDLYKSTANGFVWVATITKSVPALSGNRTTAVNFSYKFTSDDAKLGKVTFKTVATIMGARDAYPSDNEAISSITKVTK